MPDGVRSNTVPCPLEYGDVPARRRSVEHAFDCNQSRRRQRTITVAVFGTFEPVDDAFSRRRVRGDVKDGSTSGDTLSRVEAARCSRPIEFVSKNDQARNRQCAVFAPRKAIDDPLFAR